jgi:hypothetical protein
MSSAGYHFGARASATGTTREEPFLAPPMGFVVVWADISELLDEGYGGGGGGGGQLEPLVILLIRLMGESRTRALISPDCD